MRKSILLLGLAVIVLSSCSKYGYVRLNFPVEPAVKLPSHLESVALMNRSLTPEENKKKKLIESIATVEIAGSDKIASDECLKGVFETVQGRSGVEFALPLDNQLYGTGTREIPELLNWDTVQAICNSTQTDALLVLENFDSNTEGIALAVANQVANVMNGGTPNLNTPRQVRMNVVCYWRLYDPETKSIVDDYRSRSNMVFDAVGQDILSPPESALHSTAYFAGQEYITRLLPSYYTVRRDLYKRGKGSSKKDFKAAYRRAEVAKWEAAIEVWKEIEGNTKKRKNAGRASLNIAVAYEVLGETALALEWAEKAYIDYKEKLANNYADILRRRVNIEK